MDDNFATYANFPNHSAERSKFQDLKKIHDHNLTSSSGEYQASCINCSIRGHTDMECMCRNVDEGHRYVQAHVDLSKLSSTKTYLCSITNRCNKDNCIKNNHGVLDC